MKSQTLEKKTGKMTLETDAVLHLNERKQPLRKRQETCDKGINQCNRKNVTFKVRNNFLVAKRCLFFTKRIIEQKYDT